MTRDFITVVSGLPRSGTSMLMRMLEAGGLPPLTDAVRIADEDNPLGYFELEAVKALPAGDRWLDAAPGRAVKVISALVDKLPPRHRYRVIFVQRDLGEVLASQRRMLERRGEPTDRIRDEQLGPMFRRHLESVIERTKARREARVLELVHLEVLADPYGSAQRIDTFLGGGLDCDEMAAAVDAKLWRQRA